MPPASGFSTRWGPCRTPKRSSAAGVDVIVAQGVEAGGHVAGEVSTLALVPRVVDAVAPRPVVAAGGIADARGVVAVLALGAQAAMLGTRFLASTESRAHSHYKRRLLEADEGGTVRTILFGHGWPNARTGPCGRSLCSSGSARRLAVSNLAWTSRWSDTL